MTDGYFRLGSLPEWRGTDSLHGARARRSPARGTER